MSENREIKWVTNEEVQEIPKEVEEEVDRQIEMEHANVPKGLGYCHMYWARKKALLKEKGYDWKSPAEQHPNILFD